MGAPRPAHVGAQRVLTAALRPRVVLDTNVVVSALLFANGHLAWLREAWQREQFVPLVDRETAAELLRVLHYPKFKLTESDRHDLLADFLPHVETVHPGADDDGLPPLRDPADLKFLALARRAAADALVTGDADILGASDRAGVPVLTPAEFRDWLAARP